MTSFAPPYFTYNKDWYINKGDEVFLTILAPNKAKESYGEYKSGRYFKTGPSFVETSPSFDVPEAIDYIKINSSGEIEIDKDLLKDCDKSVIDEMIEEYQSYVKNGFNRSYLKFLQEKDPFLLWDDWGGCQITKTRDETSNVPSRKRDVETDRLYKEGDGAYQREMNGIVDLRGMGPEDFSNCNRTYYQGSLYVSNDNNPYKILYQANLGDYVEEFHPHPNTVAISDFAFKYIDDFENERVTQIGRFWLNRSFSGYLGFLGYVKIKDLFLEGQCKIFLQSDLDRCVLSDTYKTVDSICALNYKLSDFRNREIKPYLILGYIVMNDAGIKLDQDIIDSYERYIGKNVSLLLPLAKKEYRLMQYLCDNKLITADDVCLIKDDDIFNGKSREVLRYYIDKYDLLSKQKKQNELNLPEEEEIKVEEDKSLMVATKVDFRNGINRRFNAEPNDENRSYAPDYYEHVDLSIPDRRKYLTYLREGINKGDYYYAHYKGEGILLKVYDSGDQYYPYVTFEVVDIATIMPHKDNQLITISDLKAITLMDGDNSIISKSLLAREYIDPNGRIRLYPEKGLFKQIVYDGKKVNIPGIVNSRDIIIEKQSISFFENYFVCPAFGCESQREPEYVVFRRLMDVNNVKLLNLISNDLLVDAVDLKCAYLMPFAIDKTKDYRYKNSAGNEYNYYDILRFVSDTICKSDRAFAKRTIISSFSSYYQKENAVQFAGFSSKEIEAILDKHLVRNVVSGYYYFYDTLISDKGALLMYDKEWFRIFYDAVHKAKGNIKKCSDLKVAVKDKKVFNIYAIMPENMSYFVSMAKQCVNIDYFYESIEKFLINKNEV